MVQRGRRTGLRGNWNLCKDGVEAVSLARGLVGHACGVEHEHHRALHPARPRLSSHPMPRPLGRDYWDEFLKTPFINIQRPLKLLETELHQSGGQARG